VAITARSVFPIHGPGGLERSVYDLARHLARSNLHVTLITRRPSAPVAADAVYPGVDLKFVPYLTFPFAGRRGTTVIDRSTAYPLFGVRAGGVAARLVEQGRVDIVHGFGASVLGYARRRGRLGAPLVLNPQGLEEFGATDPSRARLKRIAYLPLRRAVIACAAAADAVIATDRSLEPAVREHLGVPAATMVTIPNALDLEAVDALAGPRDGARIRRHAGLTDDHVVLLSVGRLEENKGFQLLAQALAALREHSGRLAHGRWRWVIVGAGPFRRSLEALITTLQLAPNVLFGGKLPDAELHAWYEAADLFVHPTLYEGSSLVTLEAMAHRRACVVTDAGGLPDKVQTGVNGWNVPAGDTAMLAAAISGALEDPARLVRMGQSGRAIVERDFSWPTAARETIRLYERLMSGRRASAHA
jgi:glycosyltransferase involved in cell wall biosynthesis